MAALKYYYDLMSQPCRAVYMFLRLSKIPYEDKPVAVRKGENQTEEYAKINPFKLVPALEENGFCLTESIAMVEYIMSTRKVPEHWYPTSDPKQRARVSEYLHWQHANTRWHCAGLFQNLLVIPRATGKPVNQDRVRRGRENIQKIVVPRLESYFLRGGNQTTTTTSSSSSGAGSGARFIGGQEELSVADLFAACELMQLNGVMEEGLYERSAVIRAWMEWVKESTGSVFDEAHKAVTWCERPTRPWT